MGTAGKGTTTRRTSRGAAKGEGGGEVAAKGGGRGRVAAKGEGREEARVRRGAPPLGPLRPAHTWASAQRPKAQGPSYQNS